MKKILPLLLFMLGAFTVSMAQTTSPKAPTSVTKQDKAVMAAQKKADRQVKALEKKQVKEANSVSPVSNASTARLNKNGTPDKRFKANKQPTATPATQVQAPIAAPVQATAAAAKVKRQTPQVMQSNQVKTADKTVGTDAAGRTIYQGPRGAKYYINKNGHKEYIK